ncbi:MAG: AMP-binding protein, partial [Thermodesulfobacteriota bacterium]|nr:AMP-binding protein [Thermodesulfobacteriota bacterium]
MKKEETLCQLFFRNYLNWGNEIALRKKDYGIWNEYSWRDCYERVGKIALGLKSLGFEKGEKVAILGESTPDWFFVEVAVQCLQGVATGIFGDSNNEEVFYQVDHSDSVYVFVQDQEQTDKLIAIKDRTPKVRKVIYWEPKGLRNYEEPYLMDISDLEELGRGYKGNGQRFFEESVNQGKLEDIALLCYTSGTSGKPKGAMITHNNLITWNEWTQSRNPIYRGDNCVSYLLPGWSAVQILEYTSWLRHGMILNFPERVDTALRDLREIGPDFVVSASRMWETMVSSHQIKIADSTFLKRIIYHIFMPVAN